MGATYCAINTRLLTITQYKSNLEYSIMNISNKRQNIAYQTSSLIGADWESDPAVKRLQLMDQQLELQQKAAAAELESIQKLLQTNVKSAHTLNFNA